MKVTTEFIYRAYCSNGVILENDSDHFKELFRSAVCELRCEYGHSLYFEHGSATISYGVLTTVWISAGRMKESFIELKKVCDISVSSIEHVTYTGIRKS